MQNANNTPIRTLAATLAAAIENNETSNLVDLLQSRYDEEASYRSGDGEEFATPEDWKEANP